MTDPTPETPPTVVVVEKQPDATVTVTQSKPELKQVSNYVGTVLMGAAGWLVTNPTVVTAFIPPPWNLVASAVLGAAGAGLGAYREKTQTVVK